MKRVGGVDTPDSLQTNTGKNPNAIIVVTISLEAAKEIGIGGLQANSDSLPIIVLKLEPLFFTYSRGAGFYANKSHARADMA